jgi:tight adherence protein B
VLAEQVAALSRAGLAWPRVWQALAAGPGPESAVCAVVARQVATGGTVGGGLRSVDGAPLLGWLAIACDVAEQAGAPVAEVLDRFAAAVRADAAAAADRDAALAGPRATAMVLSWLPLGGLGLGFLIGADPVGTLLGTVPGRVCLVIGGGMWALGRWWTRVLVRRAEEAGQ